MRTRNGGTRSELDGRVAAGNFTRTATPELGTFLASFRRHGALFASVTLFFFAESALAPAMAWAQPDERAAQQSRDGTRAAAAGSSLKAKEAPRDASAFELSAEKIEEKSQTLTKSPGTASAGALHSATKDRPSDANKTPTEPVPDQALALPSGADKSGVTSKAISLPQGSGKIQGMGESFSAQLSTGIATFSVPFSLLHARGGAQPALGLSYSSGSGFGLAGVGWDVGVPFIARQTDRGVPSYDDRAEFHPNQDNFVFNGGQELVPICVVGSLTQGCSSTGETMPSWSTGAQYFRARVEGSFLRFFWSGDHRTWRVQDKSGVTMELGVPLDGSNDRSALDTNPSHPEQIYRWHLVRQYDTQGSANPAGPATSPTPNNVVVYRYFQNGRRAYLSDIYDTTPSAAAATTDTSLFAHHTRLVYEQRSDPTFSYRSGWRMEQTLRLAGVDVASKTFGDLVESARHQVRRYHLTYAAQHASLLSSVQVEGRCAGRETDAPAEQNGQPVTDMPIDSPQPSRTVEALTVTNCPTLPAMTFRYSHVTENADLPGFEGFNHELHTVQSSPPHSVDEEMTELFDINSDGLPDVLNTAVGTYGNGHGVFFNSASGKADSFGVANLMSVQGALGANANDITFRNLNLAPLDLDGDGAINLLHMPQVKTYSMYAPTLLNGGWSWVGTAVNTASGQSPKIDFGKDTLNTKVMDVNGDGLVDVVVSTGTEYQTYLSLARLPQGSGQFGTGSLATPSTGTLSTEPLRTCVPWSSTPVQLSDPDAQLADMNGDGLPDLVRLRRGDIRYWPGRGDGVWGTGERSDCTAGKFSSNGYITMGGPNYSDIQGTSLRMDDVNGDGLDDLVQVRFDAIDIWLNVDGKGWTERHIIPSTPASPSYANRVRLVDVNGSGTRDILWANAKKYQYIDLEAGKKSFLLTHVENGLGKSTDIEYTTSTAEMLAAESQRQCDSVADEQLLATSPWGCAWTMKMPTVAHVVKRVTESDNLSVAGSGFGKYVTEYQYRDPLFEGRQREFRGFTRARSKRIGDVNSPSDYTESAFLLGECEDETPGDGTDECSLAERWRDNPREALKGLPIFTEKYDERGVFLSTDSSTYRLRQLFVGLDGRRVRQAFESAKQTVVYDTAAGPQAATASNSTTVDLQIPHPAASWDPIGQQASSPGTPPVADDSVTFSRASLVPQRGTAGSATMRSASEVDYAGNKLVGFDFGCLVGAACPKVGTGLVVDETIVHVTKPGLVAADKGGWLWRTQESWVTGSVHTEQRNHTFVTYDVFGNPTQTEAELHGTVSLDRFTSVTVPTTRASDAVRVPVSQNSYNDLGLLVREQAPNSLEFDQPATNGRCRDVSYESDVFGEFAVRESIHTRGGCESNGPAVLSTLALPYDRGLGAPEIVTDMQGQRTRVEYDAFGRLSALYRPKPDVAGAISDVAAVKIAYTLPSVGNPVKYSVIHTMTQDGPTYTDAQYLESYSYVDGLGRTRFGINEADKSANDLSAYIVSGVQIFDGKSAVSRKYVDYFSDTALTQPPFADVPTSAYGRQRYDAFGRQVQTFDLDGTVTLQSVYHALSSDLYDAADLQNGPHQGSYASTRSDGHGRTVATTERTHVGGSIEARDVRTQYLTSGEPEVITRVRVDKSDPAVVRWMRYDSLGRLVLNADRNTSQNFDPSPGTDPVPGTGKLKAWRYAYDYAGELVGTSDARGCGENFSYDSAGRLVTEDYSPCGGQGPYSPPASTGYPITDPNGYEVVYWYDSAPLYPFSAVSAIKRPTDYASAPGTAVGDSPYLKGRLVASWSIGKTQWISYDGRGRVTQSAVIPALPRVANDRALAATPVAARYGRRAYYRNFVFDAADREVSATTGSTVAELQGVADSTLASGAETSAVVTEYSARGTVKAVRSTYGDLVTSVTRSADGLVNQIQYGDKAQTTTENDFDTRRRLRNVQTYRGPPDHWPSPPTNYTPAPTYNVANAPPSTFQLVLQDQQLTYDVVGNPTEIRDYRAPEDWPAGAKPLTKKIQYDDLYRATRIDYQATGGVDAWTSPYAAELAGQADPRRAQPAPHVAFDSRPLYQTFRYDWLGNTEASDDDAHGFYDRSLGAITNDTSGTNPHPYQLKSASNKLGPAGTRSGAVDVKYDAMGNVQRVNLERNGACLPSGSPCSSRWDLQYDEVGRLSRIQRLDFPTASLPPIDTNTTGRTRDLQFLYDESDQRIVKMMTDASDQVRTTLYPFETLEVRGTVLDSSTVPQGYYESTLSSGNEVPYLVAHGMRLARLHYEQPAVGEPRVAGAALHVLFELGDHLGSTSVVLDKETSELVEASTFQGYGAKESDYRPERWKGFREDYGFTGKEDDSEFGIVYFGKRFYSPYLNRWLTTDPLAVHGLGKGGLNLYAYVDGRVLIVVDPMGLDLTWADIGYTLNPLPSGRFGQYLAHGDFPTLQNERAMTALQNKVLAITVGTELALATGGLASAAGAGILTTGAVGGIGFGVGERAQSAASAGASPTQVAKAAIATPAVVAADAAVGMGTAAGGELLGPAIKSVTRAGVPKWLTNYMKRQSAPSPAPERVTVYRGIPMSHPGYQDALEGRAVPQGGDATAIEHNRGETRSVYTSWTTDRKVAEGFATNDGGNGVVLEDNVAKSDLVGSKDVFDESEVLRQGPVEGANPTPAKDR